MSPKTRQTYPAARWAERDDFGSPFLNRFPRKLPATIEWEYLAFLGHFVVGLHDVHEHSFDSWDRVWKENCDELLVPLFRVEEIAKMLEITLEDADQWLAYRTLSTQVPLPLMEFLSIDYCEVEANLPKRIPAQTSVPPTTQPFKLKESNLHFAPEHDPRRYERASLFLDMTLTYGEVPWQTLFRETATDYLSFRPEGLSELRDAITDEDVSGRIGTLPEGAYSDKALTLLLEARIENLVAPEPLWKAILNGDFSALGTEGWRLNLPPVKETH
ncbi:hypothetical protein [Armatimonas sp.]|uniref:hypothetical protein n=1 Tax=Armatimonas sp. TaxID=1872638 RepID=UPI00286B6ABC|nr:hypothetical protein [Armatimonas sp.]